MFIYRCEEQDETVSANDKKIVEELLGRKPRGLEAIPVRRKNSNPVVIRVASLVDNKPFPTLYWLVDPALNYQIDQLEADGHIARLQCIINESPDLQESLIEDHRVYISLREQYYSPEIRKYLAAKNYQNSLMQKGVGGLGNFTRIRCLHTWYAAHLVVPNVVGGMLASEIQLGCQCESADS